MAKQLQSHDVHGNTYDITTDDLIWRPSAYGIVTHTDKILLVKARDRFHMPGGGIDLGELPEQAVIREVLEETGIAVTNPQLAGSLNGFFTRTHRHTTGQIQHMQSLLLYYICELASDDIALSTDNLMTDEKAYGLTPEWVDISLIETIPMGTTVDWRPIVKKALGM